MVELLVVGLPCLNEEKSIASLILKIRADKIVVCDDGSTDLTLLIAQKLGAKVIQHHKNQGYGAAIASLFKEAKCFNADVFVTIDGDGQHNPDDIPKLIEPIEKGDADIVIGSRFLKSKTNPIRSAGVKSITLLTNTLSNLHLTDSQSGFRAYSKKALDLAPSEMGMSASTEILQKASSAGLKIVEVPIVISYGKKAKLKTTEQGFDVILSTIKYWSIHHPFISYGMPGAGFLLLSLVLWFRVITYFATTGGLVTNVVIVAVFSSMAGLLFLMTGMILWVLVTVVRDKQA